MAASPNPQCTEYEMQSVDQWIARQDMKLDRAQAIRHLVENCAADSTMSPTESRALKVLKRLSWKGNDSDLGTVVASDWSGIEINLGQRQKKFTHHNNTEKHRACRLGLKASPSGDGRLQKLINGAD
jgi:hypothetical protein